MKAAARLGTGSLFPVHGPVLGVQKAFSKERGLVNGTFSEFTNQPVLEISSDSTSGASSTLFALHIRFLLSTRVNVDDFLCILNLHPYSQQ